MNSEANLARPKGKSKTVTISLRITPETAELWEQLAEYLGISKVSAFEQAIRKIARQEGLRSAEPGSNRDSET